MWDGDEKIQWGTRPRRLLRDWYAGICSLQRRQVCCTFTRFALLLDGPPRKTCFRPPRYQLGELDHPSDSPVQHDCCSLNRRGRGSKTGNTFHMHKYGIISRRRKGKKGRRNFGWLFGRFIWTINLLHCRICGHVGAMEWYQRCQYSIFTPWYFFPLFAAHWPLRPFCSLLTSVIHHFQPSVLSSAAQLHHRQRDGFPLAAPPASARRRDIMTPSRSVNGTSGAIVGVWSSSSDTTWHLDWDTLQKLKDVWICLNKWRYLLKSWTLLCFTERPNCWNWF